MKKNSYHKPHLVTMESLSMELLFANDQLKKERAMKNEMLANISHDLRAPITSIRSALDYLIEYSGDNQEEYQTILKLLDTRTSNLETLIKDLFYLTAMDIEENSFHFEEIDIVPFLEEYYFNLTVDSKYAEREFELEIPLDYSLLISIDIQRMVRVLDNLFTNALKYSRPGDKIILSLHQTDGCVHIVVTDTGIGIPEESIPYIFQRSYMVSDARTPDATTGSGLGLSIVKNIIEKHQGSIVCHSKLGEGSSFTIMLPYHH